MPDFWKFAVEELDEVSEWFAGGRLKFVLAVEDLWDKEVQSPLTVCLIGVLTF